MPANKQQYIENIKMQIKKLESEIEQSHAELQDYILSRQEEIDDMLADLAQLKRILKNGSS